MGFSHKLQYYLVHTLKLSNKEASQLIKLGRVQVNGKRVTENCVINAHEEIAIDNKTVREKITYRYYCFHKPKGFESTFNEKLEYSLSQFFDTPAGLTIAGRLDKASEGLLLISDDGKWVEKICNPNFEKEKEYLVQLNTIPSPEAIAQFENGFEFRYGYQSKPCTCEMIAENTYRIILREGKNRQIRRMWFKLGYKVEKLLRIRIDTYLLGKLEAGKHTDFQPI